MMPMDNGQWTMDNGQKKYFFRESGGLVNGI